MGGVLLWDTVVAAWVIRHAYRNQPTWRKPPKIPDLVEKRRLTRDWRPML
jgi:hypothetical protein